MKEYLEEVERKLNRLKRNNSFVVSVYNTKSEVLAIPVPIQRELAQNGYSFSSKDFNKLKKIWEYIWKKSKILEVKGQSLYFYELKKKRSDFINYFPQLRSFVREIDNWAHSDILSDFFSRFLEEDFERVSPFLSRWNNSQNPWARRQSLVSLFYYQKLRTKFPPLNFVISLIKPLIKDPDYYVQKGLGWTLREAIQVYPREIEKLVGQFLFDLSPIAFTTVCEKMSRVKKNKYKRLRKKFRQKGRK